MFSNHNEKPHNTGGSKDDAEGMWHEYVFNGSEQIEVNMSEFEHAIKGFV
jgi:hypothetical protein